ncbi:hypothetical protein PspCFBP13509_02795 [Pseudomonas sp. CFBP13509]|uniref:type II toxin-antitoxin system RelB family antitoxin n=1 Tax=Pseudomonas sp. CFBP13509 TaxID=2184008 RepID=UPI0010BF733C|nr:hypothetical protein [Pseudomonas sp. CFBP13509]TKJ82352.1 hypothetical protein PspCFBP13509_02795 [Pseudomonas sp. CFBP13509]
MKSEFPEIAQGIDSEASYDLWFRTKVQEALDDPRPGVAHEQVMSEMNALIKAKLLTPPPE